MPSKESRYMDQLDSTRNELRAALSKIKDLEEKQDIEQERIVFLEALVNTDELQKLKDENASLKQDKADAEQDVRKLRKENKALREENQYLTEDNAKAETEIKVWVNKVADARRESGRLSTDYRALAERNDAQTKKIDDLKTALLCERSEVLLERERREEVERRVTRRDRTIERLEGKLDDSKQALNKAREGHKQNIEETLRANATKNKENTRLSNNIRHLNNCLDRKTKHVNRLTDAVALANNDLWAIGSYVDTSLCGRDEPAFILRRPTNASNVMVSTAGFNSTFALFTWGL